MQTLEANSNTKEQCKMYRRAGRNFVISIHLTFFQPYLHFHGYVGYVYLQKSAWSAVSSALIVHIKRACIVNASIVKQQQNRGIVKCDSKVIKAIRSPKCLRFTENVHFLLFLVMHQIWYIMSKVEGGKNNILDLYAVLLFSQIFFGNMSIL